MIRASMAIRFTSRKLPEFRSKQHNLNSWRIQLLSRKCWFNSVRMPDPFAVHVEACRGRQRRLLEMALPAEADDRCLVLLTRRESVQWATGALVRPPFEAIAAIKKDGRAALILPEHQVSELAAVDEIVGYEGKRHSTMIDEHRSTCSDVLRAKFPGSWWYIAVEYEAFLPKFLHDVEARVLLPIDRELSYLRRSKDPDELRMLARANEANRAMYEHARRIVRPGLNELKLYTELYSVAVQTLGEPPTYFGQDFRFSQGGGPPRNRVAEAGELLILDLGVGFRGYYSDNARTISVDGKPTAQQREACDVVASVLKLIQAEARPGVRCRHLYDLAHQQLNSRPPWTFNHHLGHGVGLAAHEGPHLNPKWGDVLAEGDFLAVEPGVYHESLRAGVRIEQNFSITANGAELLTDWPLGLSATE
jgi:Xaa-Pro aminopeptidase